MLSCTRGCTRRVTRHANGAIAFEGTGLFGGAERKQARQVLVSVGLRADFDKMVGLTGLQGMPPALEFFDNLHGVGGMFVSDGWAILVGVQDQRDIAMGVIGRWPAQVATIYSQTTGTRPTQKDLLKFTLDAAIRRCMAHEIGHALLASGWPNPYAPDEEAGADFYAGKLDAARGLNRDLGEMLFYSIGCTGVACDHPDPPTRAEAYRAGYDEQSRAA